MPTGGLSGTQISFSETPASGFLAGTTFQIPATRVQCYLKQGTGVDQCDGVSAEIISLVASTPQIVDLSALTDAITGAALTVARIVFIAFKNLATTDGYNVLIGDAATNEFDGFLSAAATMTLFPSSPLNDGFVVISAPNATGMPVNSTHKALKLDPGSNAIQVVMIVGTRSA